MPGSTGELAVGLNAVIIAVTREVPRFLTVPWQDAVPIAPWALPDWVGVESRAVLPYGPLDPRHDRQLEEALRRWVKGQTGLDLGYVEQLYTFGDLHRDPADLHGGPRAVSVAYLALVRESRVSDPTRAQWRDVYACFPWEDWRNGKPSLLEGCLEPLLGQWVQAATSPAVASARRERVEIAFGLGRAGWDGERVLERYELLYEAGLVAERWRDAAHLLAAGADKAALPPGLARPGSEPQSGHSLGLDHRRIVATALGRLRGKLKYRPLVFELLAPTFTLLQLQRVVEALAGMRLHKNNFRRLVERGGLVERTGERCRRTGGRPAELFRFRHEVLRERKAPGVGLPGLPAAD